MLTLARCREVLVEVVGAAADVSPQPEAWMTDKTAGAYNAYRWLLRDQNGSTAFAVADVITSVSESVWRAYCEETAALFGCVGSQAAVATKVGHGGSGGVGVTCACGGLATRFGGPRLNPMCRACDMRRLVAEQPKPVTPPAPTHCACGAELRTSGRNFRKNGARCCGDCLFQLGPEPDLDARIRAAQSDPDPSSEWAAGATPTLEWP